HDDNAEGHEHAHDHDHDRDRDHGHTHTHEEGDPHFWLDVANAMHYVRRIEQALSQADPARADYYRARAEAYLAELEELDRWIVSEIQRIPPERRVLVTYHDAYGYMADRYGLELVGFLVRNPDREPAPREMAALVEAIQERGVPTVFAEPQVNPRFIEALAREAGVGVGILYTDALTDEVPTYIEMMRTNVRALVDGLSR
ncbi:MAG: zinc ABC transporter substrate-binding protein, partial [Bacillota bacterium]